jgi:hypothetical protein
VFDPLALVLILAADQTFEWAREDEKNSKVKYEPDDGPITNVQLDKIKDIAGDIKAKMTSLFDKKEPEEAIEAPPEESAEEETAEIKKSRFEDGLNGISAEDFLDFVTANTVIVENQEPIVSIPIAAIEEVKKPPKPKPRTLFHHHMAKQEAEAEIEPPPDHPHADPVPILSRNSTVTIPSFAASENDTTPVNAGFGTQFPTNPEKGDMFLRVDNLPSKLYKWNEKKWIEVDKTKTDSFAYNDAYIKHLIEKIASGEYDIDMISAAEQEQIQRYLNGTAI